MRGRRYRLERRDGRIVASNPAKETVRIVASTESVPGPLAERSVEVVRDEHGLAVGTEPMTASGVRRALRTAPAPLSEAQLVATYDLTRGTLSERAFIDAVMAARYTDLAGDSWPTESRGLVDDPRMIFREGDSSAVLRLADGTLAIVMVGWGSCRVVAAGASADAPRALCAAFRTLYPASYLVEEGESRAPVTFWTNGRFGPTSRLRKIEAEPWAEIAANYCSAARQELDRMMGWVDGPDVDGQLVLFQGTPGTGKTYVLRALVREWSAWAEFHYITDPDAFFVSDPSYMIDVLLADSYQAIEETTGEVFDEERKDGKWRVLLLEDTGELLAANAKEAYGQGLSRLLNVVDGMIGQGLRVLVVVTTNDELGDLHPAVKRDGRCAVALEFGPLSAEEASAWLGEPVDEGGTIAELYARRSSTTR